MKLQLLESLQDISSQPINNLSGAYYAVNQQMDPRFGGNCIAKSLDVANLCDENGLSVQTLIAAKTHRACLITDEFGEQYFFDPSLFMAAPELINDNLLMDEIDHDCVNPCKFPSIFYSSISLFGTTAKFDVNWDVTTPYDDYDFSYNFSLLSKDLQLPRPDAADKIRSKPDSLYLRFLNLEDGYLYCLQYMSFSRKIIIKPHFTSKIHFLDSNSFDVRNLISEMEASLDLTELQVRDYFARSAEIMSEASLIWNHSYER